MQLVAHRLLRLACRSQSRRGARQEPNGYIALYRPDWTKVLVSVGNDDVGVAANLL